MSDARTMLTVRNALLALGVVLVLGVIAGMGIAWKLWVKNPQTTTQQTYEPGERNPDQSYKLEKTPTETPKPQQFVPTTAKVQSTIHGVIRPHGPRNVAAPRTPGISETAPQPQPSSEPSDVAVDVTIYDTKDGQSHAVMSSPDGTVISGNYSPIVKRVKLSELKNAIGIFGGVTTAPARELGVFYDRDFAFARLGAEVSQTKYLHSGATDYGLRIKAGIRF